MRHQVSVVIPTHNRAALVTEAIESVLRQSIQVHEIIVIDDGSTDSTQKRVSAYGAPVILLTQQHAGAGAARNRGLERATGDWIALLDSDDVWESTKLQEQLRYADEHPDCGLVHMGYYEYGKRKVAVRLSSRFLNEQYDVQNLLFAKDWICTSSVLFRRSIPVRFHEWALRSQDVIFFADLMRQGIRFGYIDKPLVGYRLHSGSVNRQPGSQALGASCQWRWVAETFASDPDELRRLHLHLLHAGVEAMEDARRRRKCRSYSEWRRWLVNHWPPDLAQPDVLHERIGLPLVDDIIGGYERLAPLWNALQAGSWVIRHRIERWKARRAGVASGSSHPSTVMDPVSFDRS